MENLEEIQKFIEKNSELFWHIPKQKLKDISLDVLVEYVINYGDYDSVKELLQLIGVEEVAYIFRKNNLDSRSNYNSLNRHFFNLYFNRHAPRNS
jgi:hypothetical protein